MATYKDAHAYAVEVGEILSKVLNVHITAETLPDGKMYFNIADRVLNETLKNNYSLVSDYTEDVQTRLNQQAGLKLRAQRPDFDQDRVKGFVNKLSSADDFTDVQWVLGDPMVNFTQSVVDEAIKKNAKFHSDAGMKAVIKRQVKGKACKWCRGLEGTYDYPKGTPNEVFHRHENCRCVTEYYPEKKKARQDVWSKVWRKDENEQSNGIIEPYKGRLTIDERAAILRYVSSESYILNDLMRKNIELPTELQELHDNLSKALDKLPKYSGEINRSLYFDDDKDAEDFVKLHNIGKTVGYKHFLSFLTEIYNEEDSVRIKILNSKNNTDLRKFNSAEKETLYKPGQKFIVQDKYFDGERSIIVLKELE